MFDNQFIPTDLEPKIRELMRFKEKREARAELMTIYYTYVNMESPNLIAIKVKKDVNCQKCIHKAISFFQKFYPDAPEPTER